MTMERAMDEEAVRELGFDDLHEFHMLVAAADLSTPEKRAAFKAWQNEDGTKAGLSAL